MNFVLGICTIFTTLAMATAPAPATTATQPEEENFLSSEEITEYCVYAEEEFGVPYSLLYGVVMAESSGNASAANGKCVGLCQVSTKWHADRAERLGVEDFYDPYGNIRLAADYLRELYGKKKSWEYALMRYNMKTETANELWEQGIVSGYAKKVLATKSRTESGEDAEVLEALRESYRQAHESDLSLAAENSRDEK